MAVCLAFSRAPLTSPNRCHSPTAGVQSSTAAAIRRSYSTTAFASRTPAGGNAASSGTGRVRRPTATYGTIRRHGVDGKWCAQLDKRHRGSKPASVPTVHSGRSHPSWGFPRKSNGDHQSGKGEEQTGECLLQRNEINLTNPDEERSTQGVKDARHPQSR